MRRGPYASESMRTRRRTTLGFQPPAVGEEEIAAVAEAYRPVAPPVSVLIVLGNRGAEDALTHDPTTIGFDLAARRDA